MCYMVSSSSKKLSQNGQTPLTAEPQECASDTAALADMLKPYPAVVMETYEVSSLVNSYTYDRLEVIEPVA